MDFRGFSSTFPWVFDDFHQVFDGFSRIFDGLKGFEWSDFVGGSREAAQMMNPTEGLPDNILTADGGLMEASGGAANGSLK